MPAPAIIPRGDSESPYCLSLEKLFVPRRATRFLLVLSSAIVFPGKYSTIISDVPSRPGNVGHSDVSLNDTHTRARAIYAIINIQFGIKSGVFASQFRGMSTFKLR